MNGKDTQYVLETMQQQMDEIKEHLMSIELKMDELQKERVKV